MLVGRLGVLGWGFSLATGDVGAGNVVMGEGEGLGISGIPGFDPLDARCTPPPGGHSRDLQMLPVPQGGQKWFQPRFLGDDRAVRAQTEGKLSLQPVPPLSKSFPTGLRKCVPLGPPWWSSG